MSNVSVIIPTKNRLPLLLVTLENLLKQSLPPLEVIVIDDGSRDGTIEYLTNNFNSKVKAIKNKGKGPGAARNTGLEVATGKYIKFFDSDDLMTSNCLDLQVQLIKKLDKNFVYGPYFYGKQNQLNEWMLADPAILSYYPFDHNGLNYWMIRGLFIPVPTMLFKADFLKKVGPWREDIIAYEDWDYLFRISLHDAHPGHSNGCAFLYRVHGNQTVGDNFSNEKRDVDKFKMLLSLYKAYINGPGFSRFEKLLFQNHFYHTLKLYPKCHEPFSFLDLRFNWINSLIWLSVKIDHKIGRSITNCSWQPEYGPLKDSGKFMEYLKLIN